MHYKSLLYLGLFLILFLNCKSEKPSEEDQLLAKAKAIHDRVLTLDTHCDINVANFTDSINYTQDLDTQITLPKMKAGGLDVAWFIVYTGQDSLNETGYKKAYENAMSKFNAIHKLVDDIAPEEIELAVTSEEVRKIAAKGKKVAMIGIENGYPVGLDITNVEKFYNLGARYMSLSHNGHSQLCDSNTGESDDVWLHNGLSDLGKQVVVEMNRLGMMIDVSHPSKEAMKQMIELSKAPIIASHSSARALCNHSRNLDDEQLEWMKENGGVVQTVAFRSYLNTEKNEARTEALKDVEKTVMDSLGSKWMSISEIRQLPKGEERDSYIDTYRTMKKIVKEKAKTMTDLPPDVAVTDFVDHIDYLVEKLGLNHVGISSDFDGGGGIEGWSDASETFNVTLELVKRGYTEEEIEKLWSGNLLRVLDEVEAVAKQIQSEA
ncbi:membrane dipeptidase [Winogradskyella epiphytica]|uniref:Membrane dipeptidase n=1 Tax=Winogradskyella epiphytica TaxID=262005 RepID=A0A2V4XIZ0_9FLAO|nr:dipeptidase [Winogradskyella epiphytica]PYE81603.1 membrane dipeptidase [Winogradskyella epiphytica]GGW63956.1 dipeptidase [Winogradskyella epiphytica]